MHQQTHLPESTGRLKVLTGAARDRYLIENAGYSVGDVRQLVLLEQSYQKEQRLTEIDAIALAKERRFSGESLEMISSEHIFLALISEGDKISQQSDKKTSISLRSANPRNILS